MPDGNIVKLCIFYFGYGILTVVWSFLLKKAAISGYDISVYWRIRYMAICLGITKSWFLLLDLRSSKVMPK